MVRSRPTIRETGWIDYALSAVLGSLALFCCGQGIAQPKACAILIGIYCVGTLFSYFAATRLRHTRFAVLDGPVYAIAAGVALFGQPMLNQLLPSETFPLDLWSAGLLAWLLTLGGFAGWRDGTRLFQAVPALALFGLIGVYDTYALAPFVFFGFLLCLALMFGRAHARSMLLQASRSGFARVEEGLSLSEAEVERDSMLRAMRRGPWRWMAGPEWAVASAGAVILVSLLGAPIIKDSVQGVAGFVRFSLPPRLTRLTQASTLPLSTDTLQRLGQGPRRLSDYEVGVAELDKPRYLRTEVFEDFVSGAWAQAPEQFMPVTDEHADELALIVKPSRFPFAVEMTDSHWAQHMPAPGEIEAITDPPDARVRIDGTIDAPRATSVEGTAIESSILLNSFAPAANKVARESPDPSTTTAKVHQLVVATTVNCKTDYDKAIALMSAITNHAKYNLRAPAMPNVRDPVEYFLFTSHQGYCDLFATAMVILARDAGMDARYVIGYLTSADDRDDSGRFILRQSDAHAWAEIYFKGLGWVVFDPTTQAEDITPSDRNNLAHLAAIWGIIAAGAVLLVGIVYYVPRANLRFRMPVVAQRQRKLDRLYGQFVRIISRSAKIAKPASASPDTWIQMTRAKLGAAADEATRLNSRFVRALYSSDVLTEEQLADIGASVRAFKRVKP